MCVSGSKVYLVCVGVGYDGEGYKPTGEVLADETDLAMEDA